MAHRDIVVIGASAGGIAALTAIASDLPSGFAATVFVVVHVPPYGVSRLPEILSRVGPLPAVHAEHGMAFERGMIYIAAPDRHLLVREGWIEVSHGPRENHSRPAIDPLFRSAARAFGSRVVGVVLSGALNDGSLGVMAVKARGGVVIVQDPAEAVVDSMPRNALQMVTADHVLPSTTIAPALVKLTGNGTSRAGGETVETEDRVLDAVIAEDFAEQAHNDRADETTVFTCPECGGVIWQEGTDQHFAFRCHDGHAYGPEIFWSSKSEEFEAALWKSLRLLKEKATLSRQMATRVRERGADDGHAARIEEQAELDARYVIRIQEMLTSLPNPADLALVSSRN